MNSKSNMKTIELQITNRAYRDGKFCRQLLRSSIDVSVEIPTAYDCERYYISEYNDTNSEDCYYLLMGWASDDAGTIPTAHVPVEIIDRILLQHSLEFAIPYN